MRVIKQITIKSRYILDQAQHLEGRGGSIFLTNEYNKIFPQFRLV